jgi:hypothetical protein
VRPPIRGTAHTSRLELHPAVPMSYLMDYGGDAPPPPRKRSLLRWLNDGKRRRRRSSGRDRLLNAVLIIAIGVASALLLKATDRPTPPFVVSHANPDAHR